MKINYRCQEPLRPNEKSQLDALIPDAITNGVDLELPDEVNVEVVFNNPLNTNCTIKIYHPKRQIKFTCNLQDR